jgi:7-cyano-7-deazaguanine synthase in queuosine biosynthesis
MIQINISDVIIDIYDGPIGISCSGGADSSLLLYILMKYASGPIHVFTCSLDSKNRSTLINAPRVLSKIIDLTGNYNVYHHFHFVKDGKTIKELFEQQTQFIKNKTINWLYTGITSNPPFNVQKNFTEISQENHERNPLIQRPVYHQYYPIHTPFTNINKETIAKMYTELNLIDSLFPVTRSCESVTLTEGHCGECWWCQERMWGFNRLT